MTTLNEGETLQVPGSGSAVHTVKRSGGVYSCSCPAWRNQSLREELEGRWDDRRGVSIPGINDDVAEAEKVVARMERDLLAQKEFLARKLRAQVDTNTRLVEGERTLAQYHRDYADILTSALKGFPV